MRKIYGYVYLIRNSISGKCYVGQTTQTVSRRWDGHKSHAMCRAKSILHKAINKHGSDNFSVVELGLALSQDELNSMERMAIWSHISTDREFGYNIEHGGNCQPKSEETKARIAIAMTGRVLSPESRARIGAKHRGRKHSPETIAKRSLARTGQKRSAETCARMREALNNLSPESYTKRSEGARKSGHLRKGKTVSAEGRAKMSESQRARRARLKAEAVYLLEKDQWASAT